MIDEVVKELRWISGLPTNRSDLIVSVQWGTRYDVQFKDIVSSLDSWKRKGYHNSLFSWATVTNNMEDLFTAIKESGKPIIIVGPKYLERLFTNLSGHVVTSTEKCWLEQDRLEADLEILLQRLENPIVMYACAISAKLMICKNYYKYGDSITQLDMGANLNPYVNVPIRAWHNI